MEMFHYTANELFWHLTNLTAKEYWEYVNEGRKQVFVEISDFIV